MMTFVKNSLVDGSSGKYFKLMPLPPEEMNRTLSAGKHRLWRLAVQKSAVPALQAARAASHSRGVYGFDGLYAANPEPDRRAEFTPQGPSAKKPRILSVSVLLLSVSVPQAVMYLRPSDATATLQLFSQRRRRIPRSYLSASVFARAPGLERLHAFVGKELSGQRRRRMKRRAQGYRDHLVWADARSRKTRRPVATIRLSLL